MTTTAAPQVAPSRAVAGMLSIFGGTLLFVTQDGMMKMLLGAYPVWMLIAGRAVTTLIVFVPLILWLGKPHRLVTPLWRWHLARAVLFSVGFSMFYAAFPFMNLAALSTIFFTAPLIVAALAAVVLKEPIGPHRLGAIALGFTGTVVAMNPGGESFKWVSLLPFACAFSYATSQILARKIGDRESSLTVGLYTITFSGLMIAPMGWAFNQIVDTSALPHLRWEWHVASVHDIGRLALLGMVGMVAYTLTSRAYQIAGASLIGPFEYTYLPVAALMGWAVFDETPGWHTLAGMTLIVASGLYLLRREIIAARATRVPVPGAATGTAPGNPMPGVPLVDPD